MAEAKSKRKPSRFNGARKSAPLKAKGRRTHHHSRFTGGKRHFGKRRARSGYNRLAPSKWLLKDGTFPDRVFTELKYAQLQSTGNITKGAAYEYFFRGNSVFDPDFTGTGAQPTYFDNFSPLYLRYRVHASKITVRAVCDSTNSASFTICVSPVDLSTGYSTLADYQAGPYTKYKQVAFATSTQTVTNFMTTKKKFGFKTIADEEDMASLCSTNPAEVWYWGICIDGTDSTSTIKAALDIQIKYYVEFFDRADQNMSLEKLDAWKAKFAPKQKEELKEAPVMVSLTPRVAVRQPSKK